MIRATILAIVLVSCARAEGQTQPPAPFLIEWRTNGIPPTDAVRAVGGVDAWRALESAAAKLNAPVENRFVIQVDPANVLDSVGLPAITGKYSLLEEGIEFQPQFPLQPGLRYRATFYPKSGKPITSVLQIPATKREPSTVVTQ